MVQNNQAGLDIKGFVFDIKKYAIHDGPGIRTTVFFKGCSLQCQWCHNPESWKSHPELGLRVGRCIRCGQCIEVCKTHAISLEQGKSVTDRTKCNLCGECVRSCVVGAREIIGREISVGEVMNEVERDVVFYDQSGGGVTFSGGEPLMQPEFLTALLDRCQRQEIHTAVDTTCYAEASIIDIIGEKADLFLCDLKHMDSQIHKRSTGVDNNLILDNIKRLSGSEKQIIIRIPIIPGFNDNSENIQATGEFVASLLNVIRIDVLPYNRGGKEKSTRLSPGIEIIETKVPTEENLLSIAGHLSNYGFEVKIGG